MLCRDVGQLSYPAPQVRTAALPAMSTMLSRSALAHASFACVLPGLSSADLLVLDQEAAERSGASPARTGDLLGAIHDGGNKRHAECSGMSLDALRWRRRASSVGE